MAQKQKGVADAMIEAVIRTCTRRSDAWALRRARSRSAWTGYGRGEQACTHRGIRPQYSARIYPQQLGEPQLYYLLIFLASQLQLYVSSSCSDLPQCDNPDGVRRFLTHVWVTRMIDIPLRYCPVSCHQRNGT